MGALAAPLVSAGVQFGAQKLLGGSSSSERRAFDDLERFKPDLGVTNFSAGGLTGNRQGNVFTLAPNPTRQQALTGLTGGLQQQVNELGNLQGLVRPGFGELTRTRVAALDRARRRSIGNLRETLGQRRVLGSSFAEDALSRSEREFGQAEDEIRAESFLQELDATLNINAQKFNAFRDIFTSVFNELNFQTNAGLQLSQQANALTVSANEIMAQLISNRAGIASESARGRGEFIGSLAQPIAEGAGEFASSFFN